MIDSMWDVVVIGAGMSGLGAGIRLALGGKKVLILEQHNSIGGLNGFYSRHGIKYDVGLHAMTNFVPAGTKGHPLSKLCRQLRIPYEMLQLQEQKRSRIQFPGINLRFDNHWELFFEDICQHFPQEKENILRLDHFIEDFSETTLTGPEFISAKAWLSDFIKDPLLKEMLLLPLFYYGSAHSNDLDLRQFAILYKALYKEGFARPKGGVRTLLNLLRTRYRELGGTLKVKTKVESLDVKNGKVSRILLSTGEIIQAKQILSSIGFYETQALCNKHYDHFEPVITFSETISTYQESPESLHWEDTIVFFNKTNQVDYGASKLPLDLQSGVVCIPENYENSEQTQTTLRTTHLSSFDAWNLLSQTQYQEEKKRLLEASRDCAFKILGGNRPQKLLDEDMFTPLTIKRFTQHRNGAIYGSPKKFRDGYIGYKNLFICGCSCCYVCSHVLCQGDRSGQPAGRNA